MIFEHHRLRLFWLAAILGISAPWIMNHLAPGEAKERTSKTCSVRTIYDGDTMTLRCGEGRQKVRLYCIDAPEMRQKPWGRESRDYLRAITPKQVRVVEHGKDRYGRIIGEVWTDNGDDVQENLNLAMVWAGRAAVYRKYCSDREYFQAEAAARQAGSGIWERPGLHQTPWEYRRSRR